MNGKEGPPRGGDRGGLHLESHWMCDDHEFHNSFLSDRKENNQLLMWY